MKRHGDRVPDDTVAHSTWLGGLLQTEKRARIIKRINTGDINEKDRKDQTCKKIDRKYQKIRYKKDQEGKTTILPPYLKRIMFVLWSGTSVQP